jgi:hypothetical protein
MRQRGTPERTTASHFPKTHVRVPGTRPDPAVQDDGNLAGKRAGPLWFCISPLFTDPEEGSPLPRYLDKPEAVFDPIWALPHRTLHRLDDQKNSPTQQTGPSARGTAFAWQRVSYTATYSIV